MVAARKGDDRVGERRVARARRRHRDPADRRRGGELGAERAGVTVAVVRAEQPQAFEEWINYHTGILQKILDEKATDTNANTRKFVAKNTLQEWEKVRAGEQDYVGINWYFLKDYRASVRTFSEPGINTKESKSWWQFWK